MANWIRLQTVWKPSLKTALPDCSCTSHCNHASILNKSPDLDPPVYRWGWRVQNVGEEWSMTMRNMFNFSVQAFQIKWKLPHGAGTESQNKAKPFSSYPVHRPKCNNIAHRTDIAMSSLTEQQKLMHHCGSSNVCFPFSHLWPFRIWAEASQSNFLFRSWKPSFTTSQRVHLFTQSGIVAEPRQEYPIKDLRAEGLLISLLFLFLSKIVVEQISPSFVQQVLEARA